MKDKLNLYKFYHAHSHTRCYKVTLILVSKAGNPIIPWVIVLLAWLTATGPNLFMPN
jgi:hypothetical protein